MLGWLLIGLLGGCIPSRQRLRGQPVEQNAEQDGKADRRDHLVHRTGQAATARLVWCTAAPPGAQHHLLVDEVLDRRCAAGVPLFAFLDPCGVGLPFTDMARIHTR